MAKGKRKKTRRLKAKVKGMNLGISGFKVSKQELGYVKPPMGK